MPPSPHAHTPVAQLSAEDGGQLTHAPPSIPQKAAMGGDWHWPEEQQPPAQVVASQVPGPPPPPPEPPPAPPPEPPPAPPPEPPPPPPEPPAPPPAPPSSGHTKRQVLSGQQVLPEAHVPSASHATARSFEESMHWQDERERIVASRTWCRARRPFDSLRSLRVNGVMGRPGAKPRLRPGRPLRRPRPTPRRRRRWPCLRAG
jgi:outer membrane biosynthesis protein TonB